MDKHGLSGVRYVNRTWLLCEPQSPCEEYLIVHDSKATESAPAALPLGDLAEKPTVPSCKADSSRVTVVLCD
eukprot:CAMPEP_0175945112 /NCGR_PEP_ID=MMETSP0108-20121206/26522_1 /TAXON_ID=195067 ORGANISM="Goniomonas pacifica, Strain CCMP1869" /NCGR_SAMPLE_ID=MMETSP0108 /ASSEMBLY_ACC=CAM_ASM_000204 /LENGTH=71 /DNA_ID=CAMNT_0017270341 /DNA_START=417 /DNA_END=629 /DNA_ORIENTATION=+